MNMKKSKKITAMALTLAMLCTLLPVRTLANTDTDTAGTEITDEDYEYKNFGTEIAITKYNGNHKEVTIPDTIDGKKVIGILASAFEYCNSITSITIPDSVTSIGKSTFHGCSSLKNITIPDSVTSIGDWAFSECKSLTGITIPNSITNIGDWTFFDCKSLTGITIPNSITSIGDGVFSGCSSIKSITIPDSVTSIGNGAFGYCNKLTSITIPDSVTSIGHIAFYSCNKLKNITISDSVTSIGNGAFEYCSSLTNIMIPDSVTSIGNSAFDKCSNLKKVVLGSNIKEIGAFVFSGDKKLTVLNITSGKLTKNGVKNSLKGSYINTIKLSGTAKKYYKIYIKYFAKSNSGKTVSIKISTNNSPNISLSKSRITLSLAGTRTATLQVTPKNISDKVTWKTSNSHVVTVKDGKLKATGKGTAVVSAKISGKTAQCKVTVKDTAVKTITYQFSSLEEWDKVVATKERSLTFGSQAFFPNGTPYHTGNIIVKRDVLTYKKVSIKISLNTPGYYKTVYLRLPEKVQYTLHRHSLQIDNSSESIGKLMTGLVEQQVVWTQTCSCGFKNELSWDIPIDKINKLEAEQTYTVNSISRDINNQTN